MTALQNRTPAKPTAVFALLAAALLTSTAAAPTADTTYERLVNPEVHHRLVQQWMSMPA
jgi:hypothetical protein